MSEMEIWKEFFIAALNGRMAATNIIAKINGDNSYSIGLDAALVADRAMEIYRGRGGKI